jgi:hypothetical protein
MYLNRFNVRQQHVQGDVKIVRNLSRTPTDGRTISHSRHCESTRNKIGLALEHCEIRFCSCISDKVNFNFVKSIATKYCTNVKSLIGTSSF